MRLKRLVDRWGIWLLMVGFGFAYTTVSLLRHYHFESLYDLAIFDQAIWRLSQGLPPLVTVKQPAMVIWGDHYTPGLIFLAPLLRLVDQVTVLLVAQVVVVVSGAWPLYQLARRQVQSNLFALTVAFAYLAFVGVQNALLFDFHPITLVAGGFAWLFWLLDQGKMFWFYLLLAVMLHLKEDVSLMVVALAGYVIWRYRRFKLGFGLLVFGLFWFFLVTRYYIPSYSGGFSHQSSLPKDLAGWWWVISQPLAKYRTVFFSLLPFAFLPLLDLGALGMVAFHFLIHFIDPRFSGRWQLALHYRAPLAPVLAVGTIWAVRMLKKRIVKNSFPQLAPIIGVLLVVLTLVNQIGLHLPLNSLAKPALYQDLPWMAATRFVIRRVPEKAAVATQINLLPQLTHRPDIVPITVGERRFAKTNLQARLKDGSPCGLALCDWIFTQDRPWLVLDLHPGQPRVNFWSTDLDQVRKAMENLFWQRNEWWVVAQQGDAYLIRRRDGQ